MWFEYVLIVVVAVLLAFIGLAALFMAMDCEREIRELRKETADHRIEIDRANIDLNAIRASMYKAHVRAKSLEKQEAATNENLHG